MSISNFIERLIERTLSEQSKDSIQRALTPDMLPNKMRLQPPQNFVEPPAERLSLYDPTEDDDDVAKSSPMSTHRNAKREKFNPQIAIKSEEHDIPADNMLPKREGELTKASQEDDHSDIEVKTGKPVNKNTNNIESRESKKGSNITQKSNVGAEHHTNNLSSSVNSDKPPIPITQEPIKIHAHTTTAADMDNKVNTHAKIDKPATVGKINPSHQSKDTLDNSKVHLHDTIRGGEIQEPWNNGKNDSNSSTNNLESDSNKRSNIAQNKIVRAKRHLDTLSSSPSSSDAYPSPTVASNISATISDEDNLSIDGYQGDTTHKAKNVKNPPQEQFYALSGKPKTISLPRYPEPTVTINIARIEVRALMSTASREYKSEKKRSSPALSLNDYLKQRRQGEL